MSETTKTGGLPCAWCGEPVRQHGIGRTREYCSRSHRELAYRDRKQQRLIDEAVAQALAAHRPSDSSVVETAAPDSSVVESAPGSAEPAGAEVLPSAWRAPARRQLSTRRSAPAAEAPTLWEDPEIELRLARYGIGADGQALDGGEDVPAEAGTSRGGSRHGMPDRHAAAVPLPES